MKNTGIKKLKNIFNQGGQATLIMILVLLSACSIIVVAVGSLTYNEIKKLNNIVKSTQSYYVAEAGIEDALVRAQRRLLPSGCPPCNYSLSVGLPGSAAVDISGATSNPVITSKGDVENRIRKVRVNLRSTTNTTSVAFNYGVQVGYGGLHMDNNSAVIGNVYSNGPVTSGSQNPDITGTIFVASGAAAAVDQANETPMPPANSITFGNASSTQDAAQSFQVSSTNAVKQVDLFIKRTSSKPGNLTVRIVNDNGGSPGSTEFTSGSLSADNVETNFGWTLVAFSSNPQLNAGVTYWLVLDGGTSSSKYYIWAANASYSVGEVKTGQFGGSWNATGFDGYFKLHLGGTIGSIDGIDIGIGGMGDGYANTITGSTATGTLYCQSGSGNNKPCNTSKPDPVPQNMPISEANINQFKADAEAGGFIIPPGGTYTPPGGSSSLGPVKIDGNLNVPGGYILTITGTVSVTGYINFGNGAQIRLHPDYGTDSGLILADGYVYIDNGVIFSGSGQSGSHIMVLTTNDCNGVGSPTGQTCTSSNSAMYVANNSQNIILYAANGQMRLRQNVDTYEATAYRLYLEENATVTYQSGLANANFSSGPGGGYEILSWVEIE